MDNIKELPVSIRPPECSTCYFFDRQENPIVGAPAGGSCRRYPPNPMPAERFGQVGMVPMYPVVGSMMWCGEYFRHPALPPLKKLESTENH